MIAIFERRDALGLMFVSATPDEYEYMRRLDNERLFGKVIGVAEHLVFNDGVACLALRRVGRVGGG